MRIIILMACLWLPLRVQAADLSTADFICDVVTDGQERAQCVERAAVVTRQDRTTIHEGGFPWFSTIWPVDWALHYSKFAQSYHEATSSTASLPPA